MKARKFLEAQKAFILKQALTARRRQTSEVLAAQEASLGGPVSTLKADASSQYSA